MNINKLILDEAEKMKPKFMKDHEEYMEKLKNERRDCYFRSEDQFSYEQWKKEKEKQRQSFV